MSPLKRIHATTVSMNDRFTIIRKVGDIAQERNQKVQLVQRTVSSVFNRSVASLLEKKHKLSTALKIKRKRLNNTSTAMGKIGRENLGSLRKATLLDADSIRHPIKRLKSVSNQISKLKAILLKNELRRSNSMSNLNMTDRLGIRSRGGSRARSNSRSRNNLTRINFKRSLSQRSYPRVLGPPASRQRNNSQTFLNRTQSTRNRRPLSQRHRLAISSQEPSVNDQFGVRRGGSNNTQTKVIGRNRRSRRNRNAKLRNSNVHNRSVKGSTQSAAGHSRSRPHPNVNQKALRNIDNGKKQQKKRPVKREKPKLMSKEDLDKELDQYMIEAFKSS